jgi:hypothetical protein
MIVRAQISIFPKAHADRIVLAAFAGLLAIMPLSVQSQTPQISSPQLRVTALGATPCLFSGAQASLPVLVSNSTEHVFDSEVRLRIYQTTEAIAAVHQDRAWKTLRVSPGQTVLESWVVDIPAVNAETRFLVQFLLGTNTVLGTVDLRAFPTNLLHELQVLAENTPIAVLDPTSVIQPTLSTNGLQLEDLEQTGLNSFTGKLAIIGPFSATKDIPRDFLVRVKALAKRGTGIVWIQPSPSKNDPLEPSFYCMSEGRGQIVVVQAGLVSKLGLNPQSQLNLVYFCRLALRPQSLQLPGSAPNS